MMSYKLGLASHFFFLNEVNVKNDNLDTLRNNIGLGSQVRKQVKKHTSQPRG